MEKQITVAPNMAPFPPIIEEIYENVGELIHFTIVFKGDWEFRGVMTKQNLTNLADICLVEPPKGSVFVLRIPPEEDK